MPGTITGTIERIPTQQGRPQSVKITLSAIGDSANGSYPAAVINTLSGIANTWDLRGLKLYSVKILPGSPPPTAASNLTITDANGVDLLGGKGFGAIPVSGSSWIPAGPANYAFAALIQDTITANISGNSVNSAAITIILELTGD